MNRREVLASVGAASILPVAVSGSVARGSVSSARSATMPPVEGLDALLLLGPAQSGEGNHRWASVSTGDAVCGALAGKVLGGQLDWIIDPASGAVSVSLSCRMQRSDGVVLELRDHAVQMQAAAIHLGWARVRAARLT